MFSEPVICVKNLGKCYHIYRNPQDRLKQFLWRGKRRYYREFWALREVSFDVKKGEVIGVIGKNGSGKSTLLQLICGTLNPSLGSVSIKGRIAALLELGAGFNPEFTGRENVHMSAAILGLSTQEIADRFEQIVDFSEIREFIDQPVKTYSSGMFVRLAFAVATSVEPDILVIDEALSVGDGAFAYKSFERIMQMRDAGTTILFCSHALFQVESLCTRSIWIDSGKIMAEGNTDTVVTAYQTFLDNLRLSSSVQSIVATDSTENRSTEKSVSLRAQLAGVEVKIDGVAFRDKIIMSGTSTLSLKINFTSDTDLPCPSVAVTIHAMDGRTLTSTATWEDGVPLSRESDGSGMVLAVFDKIPLLKGSYLLSVHLMCERGLHLYDFVNGVATLHVQQEGRTQGFFAIPHRWDASC